MAQDNQALEPKIFDLQSDPQGRWNIDIDAKIEPGPHVVTIQDDQGNAYQVMMYVMGEKPSTSPLPTNLMPLGFIYAFLALFVLILLLIAYVFRLARKVDREYETQQKTKRRMDQTKKAVLFCFFALLITIFSGLLINRNSNFIGRILNPSQQISQVKVSGTIIDPLTLQGVIGVDLKSGSTAVKTPAGGNFIFDGVSTKTGIRLTYPRLTKALALIPSGQTNEARFNLYFDAEMFNILIAVVDFESRGQFDRAYELFSEEGKKNVSLEKFLSGAKSIFNPQNVTDQELKVAETRIIDRYYSGTFGITADKAIEVTVLANDQTDRYMMIHNENGWRVVK